MRVRVPSSVPLNEPSKRKETKLARHIYTQAIEEAVEQIEFPRVVTIDDSTVIKEVLYNPALKRMRVCFHAGAVWDYFEVWPADFASLVSAYSLGEVFNKRIRNIYRSMRVVERYDKVTDPTKDVEGKEKQEEATEPLVRYSR